MTQTSASPYLVNIVCMPCHSALKCRHCSQALQLQLLLLVAPAAMLAERSGSIDQAFTRVLGDDCSTKHGLAARQHGRAAVAIVGSHWQDVMHAALLAGSVDTCPEGAAHQMQHTAHPAWHHAKWAVHKLAREVLSGVLALFSRQGRQVVCTVWVQDAQQAGLWWC